MSTLYELTGEFLQLFEMMEELTEMEHDGTVDPEQINEQRQLLTDTLEGVKGELEIKANGYVAVLKELDSRASIARCEAEEWLKKARALEKNEERLKSALMDALIATGHDDKAGFDTGIYKLKIVNNGGAQPLEVDEDIESIPNKFVRIKKEADKKAIGEYLKSLPEGVEVPWARLLPRGRHLSIK